MYRYKKEEIIQEKSQDKVYRYKKEEIVQEKSQEKKEFKESLHVVKKEKTEFAKKKRRIHKYRTMDKNLKRALIIGGSIALLSSIVTKVSYEITYNWAKQNMTIDLPTVREVKEGKVFQNQYKEMQEESER